MRAKQIQRATKDEITEMLRMTQEEAAFQLQEGRSPISDTVSFILFRKFDWGYGYTEIVWSKYDGSVCSWNVEFGRCLVCRGIITLGETVHDCWHCKSSLYPRPRIRQRDLHEIIVPQRIRERYNPYRWCASKLVNKKYLLRCVEYLRTVGDIALGRATIGGEDWYVCYDDKQEHWVAERPVEKEDPDYRYR